MRIGDIDLRFLGNAGFLISNGKKIYIDPYKISGDLPKADVILLTHGHADHCSIEDLNKLVQEGTKIICPADCQSKVARFSVPIRLEIVEPGMELSMSDAKVYVFPAYNVDKTFHPRDEHWVGYLIKMNDVLIYHAGDTDEIPEMQKLTGHKQEGREFVALLPVGGRFTMSAEEAADAAKKIKPTLAIPMHYGSVAGTEDDAKEFVELCKENGVNAQILERE